MKFIEMASILGVEIRETDISIIHHLPSTTTLKTVFFVALFSQSIWCVGGQGGPSPSNTLQTAIFFIKQVKTVFVCLKDRHLKH